MADKDHEEIAEELVSLTPSAKHQWDWINGFFETMRNEWDGIDVVRIDKFMYLVRLFVKILLENAIDDPSQLQKLMKNLIDKCSYKGIGLLFHIADVYVEELPDLMLSQKLEFIEPFVGLMKSSKLNQVIDMVYNRILLKLAETRDKGLMDWAHKEATSQ